MAYDVKQAKSYQQPAQAMSQLAAATVARLGGKADKKNNPAAGHIEVTFNKQVKNQMLPNRIQLVVKLEAVSPESSQLSVLAYPVDPVGNKLMFGVRGNAARTVVDAFWAELEAQAG